MAKALFLDRDGVINRERGEYTFKTEDFEVLPELIETLKQVQAQGYLIIVITNQGGIAKGLYTKEDVLACHQKFVSACASHDVQVTDIFYSPHHQDYSRSLDRKPDSLMLEKAMAIYDIDPSESFLIGDSQRDIDAANKVNIPSFLIPKNTPITFILNHLK
jgi:D-glycero-D-manno-heptose 1,7-bisphosphate phosphatase